MTTEPAFDAATLRSAFAAFPTGVTAVCAVRDGTPVGMAASSFTSVSLDPPLVSVCIARTSGTWPLLRDAPELGVSVLAADQAHLARQLAARGVDRFADVVTTRTDDGAVLVAGACLWIACELDDELPAGDHVIALLRIRAVTPFEGRQPLVFHRSAYRELVPPAE